jgi:hypothetical protein
MNTSIAFSNTTIDATAQRISMNQSAEEIKEYLSALGLSDYNSYLCYKAAKFLLDSGTFYPRQGKDTR